VHLLLGVLMVRLNPNGTADVVDQDIDTTIRLEGLVHQVLRPGQCAHVYQHFGSVHAVLAQLSSGPGATLVDALSYHDLPPPPPPGAWPWRGRCPGRLR